MFGPRFHLCTLFGFPVYIDLSWFLIVILITWSLATGLFANLEMVGVDAAAAQQLREDAVGTRWLMGLASALLLFASVLFHELGHALVAERFGVRMRGITLFIFGGVAEMTEEPPSPKAEFWVAVGGPLVTVAIAVLCGLAWAGTLIAGSPLAVTAVIGWLFIVNAVLLVFNMVPAFPLDGGRVLRAAIWQGTGNMLKATRITARIGGGFGIFLMIFGAFQLIVPPHNVIGFIWFLIIGLFLRAAAQMSYQRLLARQALEGESLERFMSSEPIAVTPDTTVQELVDDFIYRYNHKMFPVIEPTGWLVDPQRSQEAERDYPDGMLTGAITGAHTRDHQLLGAVTINQVKQIPRERWPQVTVRELYEPVSESNAIAIDEDPLKLLTSMHTTQQSRMMVVRDGRLVGIISLKDLMDFLSMKIELEEQR